MNSLTKSDLLKKSWRKLHLVRAGGTLAPQCRPGLRGTATSEASQVASVAMPLQGSVLDVAAAPLRRLLVERLPRRVAAPVEVDTVVIHELGSDNVQQHLYAAATTRVA